MKEYDVIGLGNTLMDLLIEVEDDKLLELDLSKGKFHLLDGLNAEKLLEKIEKDELKMEIVPGGSSANTVKGISFLGGKSILIGKVGNDNHGEVYIQEINKHGVTSRINKHSSITGHAVTFITPDAERTFSVHLGAAVQLSKEDVLEEDIQKSKVLHQEGYQVEGPTRETILHAIKLAKKHNTLVSIDLSDSGVIRRNKEFLKELVMHHSDIVFVNEVEAKEFTGLEEKDAVVELAKHADIAVVKLGVRGSLICKGKNIISVDSHPAETLDTTGAGDSYAAGFLYGFCNGWTLENSGKLGSLLASKVVEKKGVRFDFNAEELKNKINSLSSQ